MTSNTISSQSHHPKLVEQRLADLNNEADARTVYTYDGAVHLEVEVARSTIGGRKQKGPYEARVLWGSRNGLSLDEAEEFANTLLAAIGRAREDVVRRCGFRTTEQNNAVDQTSVRSAHRH